MASAHKQFGIFVNKGLGDDTYKTHQHTYYVTSSYKIKNLSSDDIGPRSDDVSVRGCG